MCGSVGVVLGFSFSSQFGCECWKHVPLVSPLIDTCTGSSPATLVPLITGTVILVLGSVYEKYTKRDALFPSRMFNSATVGESHLDKKCTRIQSSFQASFLS